MSQYTGLSLVPLDQMAGVFSAAVAHAQKVKVIQQGQWLRPAGAAARAVVSGC